MSGEPAAEREVIIVGAGPAGLAAARRLAELGVKDILVLEREAEAGGVPRHCGHTGFGIRTFYRPLTGPAYARRLVRAAAEGPAGIEIRTRTTVTRLEPGGMLRVSAPEGPATLRARRVLLALGARETPRSTRLVSGARPWGVTTTGALQQFVYLAGLKPFERAVIVGTELVSFSALLTLRHAGIAAAAMIEEGGRITARRPGDLIARMVFGVPVLTDARLVAIRGNARVEGVEIERHGTRAVIPCDGVVFTGRFVPETALLKGSHLALDPGTGGPVIDQHGRCSDPCYFAAGNLLRPIETAGVAWEEGRLVAAAIAASLRGDLPPPARTVPVTATAPLRYVYPQRIGLPGWPVPSLLLRARVERETRGRLRLLANGREVWSRRVHALPERRISLPADRVPLEGLETLSVELVED